jgi:hypothetical protein
VQQPKTKRRIVIDDTDDWPLTSPQQQVIKADQLGQCVADGAVVFSPAIETQAATAPVVSAPTMSDMPALMSDSDDCSSSDDEVMTQPRMLTNRDSWAMRNLKLLKDEEANNGRNSRRVFQHIQGWVIAKAAAVIDLVSDEDSSDTMMSDPRQLDDEPGFETLGRPSWRHVHALRVLGLLQDSDSSTGKNCMREFRRIQGFVAAEAASVIHTEAEEQHRGNNLPTHQNTFITRFNHQVPLTNTLLSACHPRTHTMHHSCCKRLHRLFHFSSVIPSTFGKWYHQRPSTWMFQRSIQRIVTLTIQQMNQSHR